MKLINIVLLIGLILLLFSCKQNEKNELQFTANSADTMKAIHVSMKTLQTTYKSLQGQKIETEGLVSYKFESVCICSDEGLVFDGHKCFWISLSKQLPVNDSLKNLIDGNVFTIRGTIDTSNTGHFGMYLATIKNIYFMQQK